MAFREMRRKKQLLEQSESFEILKRGQTGFLAVAGDEDYPYIVPLNYVYHEQAIYIHCAKHGHKIDAIKQNPKVSFCVVDQDEVLPDLFATAYKSVIVFGIASLIEGEELKRYFIEMLGRKYNPHNEEALQQEIQKDFDHMAMIKVSIEHITGKVALNLLESQ